MVSRQTVDRRVELGQTFADPHIAFRTGIVHQISGGEDEIGGGKMLTGQGQHLVEGVQGIDAKESPARIRKDMGIGNLQGQQTSRRQLIPERGCGYAQHPSAQSHGFVPRIHCYYGLLLGFV